MWEAVAIVLSCVGFAWALAVLLVEIPLQLTLPRHRR
jgi:hypothetical protein